MGVKSKSCCRRLAVILLSVFMFVQTAAVPAAAAVPGMVPEGYRESSIGVTDVSKTLADMESAAKLSNNWKELKKTITPSVKLSHSKYTYDGKAKKPSVTVKYNGKKLKSSDYKVSYSSGRKKVGSYKVKVTLRGKYTGSKTVKFKIVPKKTSLTSVKAVKGEAAFKLVWKKQASEVTGYQVRYSTDKKFKSNTHTVKIKGINNTSTVLKKHIVRGTKYYIRIRTYKKVGDDTFKSSWKTYGAYSLPVLTNSTTKSSSKSTEAIVKAHMNDFTYHTFDSFMASKGGAENYVRSLGGVFAKWCGEEAKVQTAGQFQEVAEYVMGIMTIWGPDYHGGSGDHKFNGNYGKGDEDGRFYEGMKVTRKWKLKPLEKVFFNDKEHIMTDCGCGVYYIMQKAGLYQKYAGIGTSSKANRRVDKSRGGAVIYKGKDLQVGDMIQMSKTKKESGWKHVAVVGEIYSNGMIITYDTGGRFVHTGKYKKHLVVNSDGSLGGDYKGYKSWFAVRMRALNQADAKR